MIKPPGGKKGERIPFSFLTKYDGVVNAYNALKMAEAISNAKNKD